MKTGFYPGCSLKGSSREYAESTLALARALEMPLQEIDDWNCCGASSAHAVDKELALALPARVLALAAEQGFDEVVVPCAACYNRLSMTRHELEQHPHGQHDPLVGPTERIDPEVVAPGNVRDLQIPFEVAQDLFRRPGRLVEQLHDLRFWQRPVLGQPLDHMKLILQRHQQDLLPLPVLSAAAGGWPPARHGRW